MSDQCCFNIRSLFKKHLSDVENKTKSVMDLQQIDKFYPNEWEDIFDNVLTI